MMTSVYRAQDVLVFKGREAPAETLRLNNLRVLDAFGVAGRELDYAFTGPRLSELGPDRPQSTGAWHVGRVITSTSPRSAMEGATKGRGAQPSREPHPPQGSSLSAAAASGRGGARGASSLVQAPCGCPPAAAAAPTAAPTSRPCGHCRLFLDHVLSDMRDYYEERLRTQRLAFQRGTRALIDRLYGGSSKHQPAGKVETTRLASREDFAAEDAAASGVPSDLDRLISALEMQAATEEEIGAAPIAVSVSELEQPADVTAVGEPAASICSMEQKKKNASTAPPRKKLFKAVRPRHPSSLPLASLAEPEIPAPCQGEGDAVRGVGHGGEEPACSLEIAADSRSPYTHGIDDGAHLPRLEINVIVPTVGHPLTPADISVNAVGVVEHAARLDTAEAIEPVSVSSSALAVSRGPLPTTHSVVPSRVRGSVRPLGPLPGSTKRQNSSILLEPATARVSSVLAVTRRHASRLSARSRAPSVASAATQTEAIEN